MCIRDSLQGREDILKVHARKIKIADNVNFHEIAKAASGASGAELANICLLYTSRCVSETGIRRKKYFGQTDILLAALEKYRQLPYLSLIHISVKILACEAVPKSKKLLKFTLDDGERKDRVILSGIHEYYEPEELVGKTAIAIVNLPPRKMMGIDSEGMLISAVHEEDGHEAVSYTHLDVYKRQGLWECAARNNP